jgi:hypothetical protein
MSTADWFGLLNVLILAFYTYATFRILKANQSVVNAMQEQTEAQLRPYVVAHVTTRIGSTLMLLEVQNIGRSPALNLSLRMDKDFFFNAEKEGQNIAQLPVFTQPIDALASGARLQFVLGVGHTVFSESESDSVCPKVFAINADYQFGGRQYVENNPIDLRPMSHSVAIQDPVADEIKMLRECLEKVLKK